MILKARLVRLEKQNIKKNKIFAFIGVPEETEGIFKFASDFWEKNKHKYANSKGVDWGAPWRYYNGKKPRFLGYGVKDDLWVAMGGGFNPDTAHFLFLEDIKPLLVQHWHDFLKIRDNLVQDKKVNQKLLENLPNGMQELLRLLFEKYTFGD